MSPFLGLHHNLLLIIFLTYGLAFFTMGVAVVLEWKSDSDLPLTRALPALAAFAFLHGLMEWTHILLIAPTGELIHGNDPPVEIAQLLLLSGSYFFLLWFGIDLVTGLNPHRIRWHWAALLLFGLWVGTAALAASAGLPAAEWVASANSLARYLLGLPGGIVVVWGLQRHRKIFRELKMPQTARDCFWAGVGFALYALATGLVTPRAPLLPASLLNYGSFQAATGLPVQIFRTLLALVLAYFIVRILRAYDEERDRRLENATRERHLAQQQLLEAHRQAEEQLRVWNETLEARVLDRTSQLERKKREAEALYQIGTEISAFLDLQTILSSVVEKARRLLAADLAAVALLDPEHNTISMQSVSGTRTEEFSRLQLRPGQGLAGQVVETGVALAIDDYLMNPEFQHVPEVDTVVSAEELRAHLVVPLKAGGRIHGVLYMANRGDRRFEEDSLWMLEQLAVCTSIAIENCCLYDKAQEVAVLQERERIGREIHDGLAQALGCLSMLARAAQSRLERANGETTARARSDLLEMEELAQESYQDAREAILGLRVSAYGGPGLVGALREYVQRFSEQSGLDTRVVIGEGWPSNLPTSVEIQVVRIVQEALSNVRKHAAAQHAWVELKSDGSRAEIAVQDDGRGFDAERCIECNGCHFDEAKCGSCGGCHFGLQTMRERARMIGGELTVHSAPGQGARMELRLPLEDSWRTGGRQRVSRLEGGSR